MGWDGWDGTDELSGTKACKKKIRKEGWAKEGKKQGPLVCYVEKVPLC